MKLLMILAAMLGFTASAHADIITCNFTEPFATITYTTGTRVLSIDAPEGTQVVKDVGFLILGAGKFELESAAGQVIMTLNLTGKGEDGMSTTVYPFEALYVPMAKNANAGVGGCSSLKLRITPES